MLCCVAVVCCRSGVSSVYSGVCCSGDHEGLWVGDGGGCGGRGGVCQVVGWLAGHQFI